MLELIEGVLMRLIETAAGSMHWFRTEVLYVAMPMTFHNPITLNHVLFR